MRVCRESVLTLNDMTVDEVFVTDTVADMWMQNKQIGPEGVVLRTSWGKCWGDVGVYNVGQYFGPPLYFSRANTPFFKIEKQRIANSLN